MLILGVPKEMYWIFLVSVITLFSVAANRFGFWVNCMLKASCWFIQVTREWWRRESKHTFTFRQHFFSLHCDQCWLEVLSKGTWLYNCCENSAKNRMRPRTPFLSCLEDLIPPALNIFLSVDGYISSDRDVGKIVMAFFSLQCNFIDCWFLNS